MKLDFLYPYCTGVAVADREADSRVVYFKPLETLPNLNGKINKEYQEAEVEVNTPKGIQKLNLKLLSYLPANWFNRNTNRITPPDIMKGERVLIWRRGNSQDYYWEPTDLDNHLRTTERIVIAISNTNRDDRSDKVLSRENCYFIEADTINKYFKISTNKNDGEPFAHTIELNTGQGFLKAFDDVGNHILKDSANTVIELYNKDETRYRMDKENILEECKGNHTRKVGGNLVEEVGGTRTRKVKGAEEVETKSLYHKNDVTTFKTDMFNADSPVSNMNGTVNMASISAAPGNGAPGGGGGSAGSASNVTLRIEGRSVFEGDIDATGEVKGKTGKFDSLEAKSASFPDGHGPH